MKGTVTRIGLLVCLACGVMAGCGGGGSASGSGHGTIAFYSFNPFSGPDAAFGPEMAVACDVAVNLINVAGGVMGHKGRCGTQDTHGDPADAVPAANQMVAATGGLVGVLGPSSDEALATVPILNQAHIPMFADTGQAAFDHSTYPYFWRISPADDVKGYAMSIWAYAHGFRNAALVFGNDVGSQSDVPTLIKAFQKLGGRIVSNLSLTLDQSSYRSEIERMLSAHPQVIFTEVDPQTAGTFLAELKQLNGRLIPIIGTETSLEAPWLQATSAAVGDAALRRYFVGVQPYAPTAGPAYQAFDSALHKVKGISASNIALYSTDPFAMGYYDSITIMALAMLAAKSTTPSAYNDKIMTVTEPGSGKKIVSTYAEGKAAIAKGQPIQFVGASGPAVFNKWHNSTGAFEIASFITAGKVQVLGEVTAAQIAQLSG